MRRNSSGYYGAVDVKTLTGLGATPIAIEEMLREVFAGSESSDALVFLFRGMASAIDQIACFWALPAPILMI